MNQLTSQQRKLIYLVGIVVLAFPIMLLGMPSARKAETASNLEKTTPEEEAPSGGVLARLRTEYEFGESNLGDVDPASETMTLVLANLRGIAANQLWLQAQRNQEIKNWAQLKTNVDSIILLQPHFVKVWEFQSWNLAYNVSGEWDLIQDKYYWIKEGAKFSIKGTRRNSNSAELYWWTGIILGDRISRHDAWRYLRKFFNPSAYEGNADEEELLGDPDIRRKTGKIAPDPVLNPEGTDNYLVAKDWFHLANEADRVKPQRRMTRIVFRQRPARAQIAYAEMMQKESRFDEQAAMKAAWAKGLREWRFRYDDNNKQGFGQEIFDSLHGKIRLEAGLLNNPSPTEEELAQANREIDELRRMDNPPNKYTRQQKRRSINTARSIVNYEYWMKRAMIEALDETILAHRELHQGRAYRRAGEYGRAIKFLESGLQRYAKLLQRKEFRSLKTRPDSVEEIMIAIVAWQDAHTIQYTNFPADKIPETNPPLTDIWNRHKGNLAQYKELLERESRIEN